MQGNIWGDFRRADLRADTIGRAEGFPESPTPRGLRSETAIQRAETNGKLVIKSTGIVVNAPVLA